MKVRSDAIRKSARGQDCALRIPGHCNFDPETTVLAHVGKNIGMSMKCDDSFAVYACSACHDQIDSRTGVMDAGTRSQYILDALEETQNHLIQAGLISVKGKK
ncbi:nuclease domain-containing protein [Marinomonas sp.]|uniref:nuclease domain-containing protein n=1 Tax=Marinomonas sp. TaxID=1904862 RepID=UPI003A94A854